MTYTVKRWKRPDSYMGATWEEYYSSGVGQSRDSDDLEKSNFAEMLKLLGGETETVMIISENHWAVGWVEWIAIHESDTKALEKAREACERLNNYPCLNEEDWSEREWNHAQESWENCSLRERVELCQKAGVSIFAARRDTVPEDDSGYLRDYLIGC